MRRELRAVPLALEIAEVVWIAALSPLLLFPGRVLPADWQWLAALATMAFWPIRWWVGGQVALPTPLRIPVLVLLLCLPAAIWAATDRPRAWEVAGYLMLGVAAANALVGWRAVRRCPEWIAWGLLVTALGLSILGPLIVTESIFSVAWVAPLQRVVRPITGRLGETINPNILANILLMALPFALALCLKPGWARRGWWPALLGLFALWLGLVLVFTESRGAWLALLVIVPLLLGLRWPRLFWLLPFALIAAAIGAWWAGPRLFDGMAAGASINGLPERLEIWLRALYLVEDFPLTGAGLGMFGQVAPFLYPYVLIPPGITIPDAHNLPLQVGADLGVPGLVAWTAIVICQAAMLILVLRRRPAPLPWALAAGSLAATAGLFAAGVFSAANWGVKPAFLPWMVTAVAVILHRRAEGMDGGEGAAGAPH